MKRFVAFLLVLLFTTPIAMAEFDYKSLSDEELLELRDSINGELFDRGVEFETDFYVGVYTAGKSIRAGSYEILFEDDPSFLQAAIRIYANETDYQERNRSDMILVEPPSKGCRLELDEGMVADVEIVGGTSMKLRKVKQIWMP